VTNYGIWFEYFDKVAGASRVGTRPILSSIFHVFYTKYQLLYL